MAGRRYRHNDREPRSIVLDVADEYDVLEVGTRVALDLIEAEHKTFRILHTVHTQRDYWHD